MPYDTFSVPAFIRSINTGLVQAMQKSRIYHGDYSRQEIINKIKREHTRTVCPKGWKFR
jgi:hypothetical protein